MLVCQLIIVVILPWISEANGKVQYSKDYYYCELLGLLEMKSH